MTTIDSVAGAGMDEWLTDDTPVVVGMACRFAGSDGLAEFWECLRRGHSALGTTDRWPDEDGAGYVGGFLDGHDEFDARYFRISPNEARWMDPQQRLLQQSVQHAVDDSYLLSEDLRELRCGVFVAGLPGDYRTVVAPRGDLAFGAHSFLGNAPSTLSGRISYFYDITGPSLTIDSACSSALATLHEAVLNVRAGHCRCAIVGAVSVFSTPEVLRFARQSRMSSPTGACLPFTDAADGFVPAEGAASVVLMRYDDAHARGLRIHGAVLATGVSHNGTTNGLMAPSSHAQSELISDVYRRAGVDTARIAYVETHGTGTPLGDPLELDGLKSAFERSGGAAGCYLGAVKPLIGHTLVCSGLAGVIKVLLSFRHDTIPPAVVTDETVSYLGIAPFEINRDPLQWPADRPLCAVSAFGFTGSNGHVVLGRTPPPRSGEHAAERRRGSALPFCLSAETERSLAELAACYRALVETMGEDQMWDLSQLLLRRWRYTHRRVVVTADRTELLDALGTAPAPRPDGLDGLDGLDEEIRNLVGYWQARDTGALRRCLDGPGELARITLPGYPFERRRYWAVEDDPGEVPPPAVGPGTADEGLLGRLCTDLSALLGFGAGADAVTPGTEIAALGLDSLSAVRLLAPYQQDGSLVKAHELFRFGTVADLAMALAALPTHPTRARAAAVSVRTPGPGPGTRWHEYGSGGRPTVLLPPLNSDRRAWVQQITALVRAGRTVCVPGYPGHGDVPFDAVRFSFEGLADEVAEFVRETTTGPADLVGWSLGGCVAALVALRHPELVGSLVLVSCAPRYDGDVFERTVDLRHELHVHGGLLDAVFDADGDPEDRFTAAAPMDVLGDYYTALSRFDIVDRLPDITAPCLVVRGAEDSVVDAEASALLTRIPGARVREFEHHGHYVPLTAGWDFNAELTAFLAGRS